MRSSKQQSEREGDETSSVGYREMESGLDASFLRSHARSEKLQERREEREEDMKLEGEGEMEALVLLVFKTGLNNRQQRSQLLVVKVFTEKKRLQLVS